MAQSRPPRRPSVVTPKLTVVDVAYTALRAIRAMEIELQIAMGGHLDQSQRIQIAMLRAWFEAILDRKTV